MLTAVVVRPNGAHPTGPARVPPAERIAVTEIDPAAISDLCQLDHQLIWVDVVDATAEDLALIAEEFSLHPLAMEDATKHGQRAKLERFPTHAFAVVYTGQLHEIDLFVCDLFFATVRGASPDGSHWPIDPSRQRFLRTSHDDPDVGLCVYTVLDDIVDSWFVKADLAEDHLETIEERVFAEERTSDERAIQQELFEIRRQRLWC
jgi:magnesium transporter